jgi:hypothetical protein
VKNLYFFYTLNLVTLILRSTFVLFKKNRCMKRYTLLFFVASILFLAPLKSSAQCFPDGFALDFYSPQVSSWPGSNWAGDVVQISSTANSTLNSLYNFSIEAMVKIDESWITSNNFGKERTIISNMINGSVNYGFTFGLKENKPYIHVGASSDGSFGGHFQMVASSGISLNEWHHIAFTFEQTGSTTISNFTLYSQNFGDQTYYNGTVKLYVDGVLVGTETNKALKHPTGNWFMGRRTDGGGTTTADYGVSAQFFNGTIDEVRIWNTVKTSFNTTSAENTSAANLIAYYLFNSGSGTSIVNSSASVNSGGSTMNATASGFDSNNDGQGEWISTGPPTPNVAVGGSTSICSGGSVLLTSNQANGNQWYKDGSAISGATNTNTTVTQPGSYTVVSTVNGCSSAASTPVVVLQLAAPSITTQPTTSIQSGLLGATVTVTAVAGLSYQWYSNTMSSNSGGTLISGATTSSYTPAPASNTYFYCVVTGACGSVTSTVSGLVTAMPSTVLTAASCGTTIPFLTTTLKANEVAGVSMYRFTINPLGSSSTYIVESSDRFFNLSEAIGMALTYNTVYSVSVSLQNAIGVWGASGNSCLVTTPAIPVTNLTAASCGATMPFLTTTLKANEVQGATMYKFVIIPLGSSTSYEVESSDRFITLSEASGMAVLYNTTYSISVSVKIGGIWGVSGNSCLVTTPAIPVTNLTAASCGATIAFLTTTLKANEVSGASMYEFLITDMSLDGEVYQVQSSDRFIVLSEGQNVDVTSPNQVLAPMFDKVYTVQIRVQIGSSWGSYGEICTIMTPNPQGLAQQDPQLYEEQSEGIQSEEQTTNDNNTVNGTTAILTESTPTTTWTATATSNPFAHSFQIKLNGVEGISSDASFTAQLTDMSGKVYIQVTLSKEQLEAESFGEQLVPGMYLMTLRQGEELRVIRVVKR